MHYRLMAQVRSVLAFRPASTKSVEMQEDKEITSPFKKRITVAYWIKRGVGRVVPSESLC